MTKEVKKLLLFNKGENHSFIVAYLVSLLYMVILLVPSELVRRIVLTIENSDRDALKRLPVWCILTILATLALIYGEKILLTKALNRSEKNMQGKLLAILCRMKKKKFQNLQTGSIVTQITQNVNTAVEEGYYSMYSFLVGILGLAFSFFYMSRLNPVLTIALVIFNVVVMIITSAISKKLKHIHKNVVSRNNSGNHLLLDMLDNAVLLRLFDKNDFFEKRYRKNEEGICKANLKAFALQNGINEMVWGGKKLAEIILIFGIGGYLVCQGEIGISIVASFTIISEPFSKILKMVVDSIFSVNKAIPSIQAVAELFEVQELEIEPEQELKASEGSIIFREVSFRHGDKVILDKVSFTIDAGDKVMIVGENGQGKTTLLNLIAGLYRPDSGEILIDGEPVNGVNLKNIAEKYCYIPQKPQIFFGNGYQNIALTEHFAQDRYDTLLKSLGIDHVAEMEARFYSEGEKQRLCIGRALNQLRKGKIVLGDEIFANVDRENRKEISRLLSAFWKDHTVLMVSHDEEFFPSNKKLTVGQGKVYLEEREVVSHV